jgi:hypothetical protein
MAIPSARGRRGTLAFAVLVGDMGASLAVTPAPRHGYGISR